MMNAGSQDFSALDAILSMVAIISFIAFGLLMASLRSHVDEEKVRNEERVSNLFRSPLLPERILTATGRQRVKAAKVALGVFVIAVATIVMRNQILIP